MEKPRAPRRRTTTNSRVACEACRRLKMRCEGSERPPCVRCTKRGRFCSIPHARQHTQPIHQVRSAVTTSEGIASAGAYAPNYSNKANGDKNEFSTTRPSSSRGLTSSVPRVFTSYSSVAGQDHWLPSVSSRPQSNAAYRPGNSDVEQVGGQASFVSDPVSQTTDPNYGRDVAFTSRVPNDEDVCHLGRFFVENLLVHIPLIARTDVGDLNDMIRCRKSLLYSMAYVAANYVPGCKSIKSALVPIMVAIARGQFDRLGDDSFTEDNLWTHFQALAVLYTWSSRQWSNAGLEFDEVPAELRQDSLRAFIETLAVKHSMHTSAADVADLLKRGEPQITQTFALRKYLFWLWLFSEAHFRSLIFQIPPTIREDAMIEQSAKLLRNEMIDHRVWQILARVDLCLVWSRVGLRERSLGEWWCGMHTQATVDSTLTLLDDMDNAVQKWHSTWSQEQIRPHAQATMEQIAPFDLLYTFTSFCICRYVATVFQSSSLTETLPRSRTNLSIKSIERAHTVCRRFLELSPLSKHSTCFAPESNFAMIEACCEHLLKVRDSPMDRHLALKEHLTSISAVAELLIDLGMNDRHPAKVYGELLLAQTQLRSAGGPPEQPKRPPVKRKRSMTWAGGGGEQNAAQSLLAFAAAPDDSMSLQGTVNQRQLSEGHHQSLASGTQQAIGLWPGYAGNNVLSNEGHYWTS